MASDPNRITKVQRKGGGDELAIASGGTITVESGALVDIQAGATFNAGGAPVKGITSGVYVVTGADATANQASVPTGLGVAVTVPIVQILRAGKVVTVDAGVAVSGTSIIVADGAATYNMTTGDVINWMAS